MWLVGFRDLQWRRRRFVIAIAATSLVFAVTLLLAGVGASFHNEVRRTIDTLDVDRWVVPKGAAGPFTSSSFIPASDATQLSRTGGVTEADPIVLFRETLARTPPRDVNMIGYVPGGVGTPKIASGRSIRADGEAVVDHSLGMSIGDTLNLSGRVLKVVGTVRGITYLAGTPTAFVSMRDAQQLLVGGQPLATAVVTRGVPRSLPPGLRLLTNAQVRTDLERPVHAASSTIGFIAIMLWLVAATIVGAVLYMSSLERIRDFAVMKATGVPNRFVLAGLASQAVVLSLGAAVIAIAVAKVLAPRFPLAVEIPTRAYIVLLVVAILVGLAGSAAGLRRAVKVDPALAFGGA